MQKVLLAGAILVVSTVTVRAQTLVPTTIPNQTQQQVAVFEGALRAAIEKATGNVADRAREITPDIVMRYQVGLEIRPFILPTDGSLSASAHMAASAISVSVAGASAMARSSPGFIAASATRSIFPVWPSGSASIITK